MTRVSREETRDKPRLTTIRSRLTMSRSLKLLLGVATGVPTVLTGYLMVRFRSTFLGILDDGATGPSELMQDTFGEFVAVQLTILGLLVALLGFYLWHLLVHQAHRKDAGQVPMWLLALLLVPIISMPIYWFIHIWPEAPQKRPQCT